MGPTSRILLRKERECARSQYTYMVLLHACSCCRLPPLRKPCEECKLPLVWAVVCCGGGSDSASDDEADKRRQLEQLEEGDGPDEDNNEDNNGDADWVRPPPLGVHRVLVVVHEGRDLRDEDGEALGPAADDWMSRVEVALEATGDGGVSSGISARRSTAFVGYRDGELAVWGDTLEFSFDMRGSIYQLETAAMRFSCRAHHCFSGDLAVGTSCDVELGRVWRSPGHGLSHQWVALGVDAEHNSVGLPLSRGEVGLPGSSVVGRESGGPVSQRVAGYLNLSIQIETQSTEAPPTTPAIDSNTQQSSSKSWRPGASDVGLMRTLWHPDIAMRSGQLQLRCLCAELHLPDGHPCLQLGILSSRESNLNLYIAAQFADDPHQLQTKTVKKAPLDGSQISFGNKPLTWPLRLPATGPKPATRLVLKMMDADIFGKDEAVGTGEIVSLWPSGISSPPQSGPIWVDMYCPLPGSSNRFNQLAIARHVDDEVPADSVYCGRVLVAVSCSFGAGLQAGSAAASPEAVIKAKDDIRYQLRVDLLRLDLFDEQEDFKPKRAAPNPQHKAGRCPSRRISASVSVGRFSNDTKQLDDVSEDEEISLTLEVQYPEDRTRSDLPDLILQISVQEDGIFGQEADVLYYRMPLKDIGALADMQHPNGLPRAIRLPLVHASDQDRSAGSVLVCVGFGRVDEAVPVERSAAQDLHDYELRLSVLQARNIPGPSAHSFGTVIRAVVDEQSVDTSVSISDGFPRWGQQLRPLSLRLASRACIEAGICPAVYLCAVNEHSVRGDSLECYANLDLAKLDLSPTWIPLSQEPDTSSTSSAGSEVLIKAELVDIDHLDAMTQDDLVDYPRPMPSFADEEQCTVEVLLLGCRGLKSSVLGDPICPFMQLGMNMKTFAQPGDARTLETRPHNVPSASDPNFCQIVRLKDIMIPADINSGDTLSIQVLDRRFQPGKEPLLGCATIPLQHYCPWNRTTPKKPTLTPEANGTAYGAYQVELEDVIGPAFDSWPLSSDATPRRETVIDRSTRRCGSIRGLIRVIDQTSSPEPFRVTNVFRPQSVQVEVFVQQCGALASHFEDITGIPRKPEPFLVARLGTEVQGDDMAYAQAPSVDAEIGQVFKFVTPLPGFSQLRLEVRDKISNTESRLVGSTLVDLDDRWCNESWHCLGRWKPFERRDLRLDATDLAQGFLDMRIDILPYPLPADDDRDKTVYVSRHGDGKPPFRPFTQQPDQVYLDKFVWDESPQKCVPRLLEMLANWPTLLFEPGRKERQTPVHKLAQKPDGCAVLEKILKHFREKHPHLLGPDGTGLGLLCKAGMSSTAGRETALAAAISSLNRATVELLLDDYIAWLLQQRTFDMEEAGSSCNEHADADLDGSSDHTPVVADYDDDSCCRGSDKLLQESDLVRLFETFPDLAVSFIKKLPLWRTCDLVRTTTRFSQWNIQPDPGIVRASHACMPTVAPSIDQILGIETPEDTDTYDILQKSRTVKPDRWWEQELGRLFRRRVDLQNGDLVQSSLLPIVGCVNVVERLANLPNDDTPLRTVNREMRTNGASRSSEGTQAYESIEAQPLQSTDLPTSHVSCQSAVPFAQLLSAAVNFAVDRRDPSVFDSSVLQIIIQYKWDTIVKSIFKTGFHVYCVYLAIFTTLCLKFQDWILDEALALRCIAWCLWAICAIYAILLGRTEARQLRVEGLVSYFKDPYNYVDSFAIILAMASITSMAAVRASSGSPTVCHAVAALKGTAGLLCWVKVLWFVRGINYKTAFLLNMLVEVTSDIGNFLVVLGVILAGFAVAFFHLLRDSTQRAVSSSSGSGVATEATPTDLESDSEYSTLPISFVLVYDMMLGAFDISTFRMAPESLLAIILFMLFMLIVPTVMLNALIAIMGDTFERVQQNMVAAGRLERAKIIAEVESTVLRPVAFADATWMEKFSWESGLPNTISRANRLRVLLTLRVRHNSPRILHVLLPRTSDQDASASSSEWQGRMRVLFAKFEQVTIELAAQRGLLRGLLARAQKS